MWVGFDFILFILGLGALLWGSNLLVNSASYIAKRFSVSPIIIGITLLSIGTSIPEISTSVAAFIMGYGDIAFGNIVGSELVQITLILAIVALIRPLKGNRKEILFYGVAMVVAILLALFTISDGVIYRSEGVLLVVAYSIFLWYIFKSGRVEKEVMLEKDKQKWYFLTLSIIIGIVIIVVGSKVMIDATINIAKFFNASEFIISVFLVGLGTSLPELVVSGVAAWKKKFDLSVGNLLGSNITDPTLSLGLGAIFVKSSAVSAFAGMSAIYLIFVCVIATVLFAWKKKITRPMAFVLLALYLASFFIF
ncbi:MAG: calcium/sodium antiporter [archaeon]